MITESLMVIFNETKDTGGILKAIFDRSKTISDFFYRSCGVTANDFEDTHVDSPKVEQFIERNRNTSSKCGSMEFIQYLFEDYSDNVLKDTISSKKITIQLPGGEVMEKSIPITGEGGIYEGFVKLRQCIFNIEDVACLINLTQQVKNDRMFEPVVGREKEIKELRIQFGKQEKNNTVLIGEPGVGKTELVKTFAFLESSITVFKLDNNMVFANKENARMIINAVMNYLHMLPGPVVLFIDEFHMLVKEGLADFWKTARDMDKSNNLKIIAATTLAEYRQFVEKDKALERRFYPIQINQVEGQVLIDILNKYSDKLESVTGIKFDKENISFIIKKMEAERQKTSPDKEKDIIDAAFSLGKIKGEENVSFDTVCEILSERLNIPKDRVSQSEPEKLRNLLFELKKNIKGQDYALNTIVNTIKSHHCGFNSERPIVFIFQGDTGIGKTETAYQLAEMLMGSKQNLISYDMNDYKESHTASSFLGAPPSYVGYGEGGSLVNIIRQKPYSVLLLDEMEKAHPDIFDIFLQIFDKGKLTDREGREADFRNVIIIMTTNAMATDDNNSESSIGFITTNDEFENKEKKTSDYLYGLAKSNRGFRKEFLNRVDAIIPFSDLTFDNLREITKSHIERSLSKIDINLSCSDGICDYIARKSGNARQIDRVIAKYIEYPISEDMIYGILKKDGSYRFAMYNNKIIVSDNRESARFLSLGEYIRKRIEEIISHFPVGIQIEDSCLKFILSKSCNNEDADDAISYYVKLLIEEYTAAGKLIPDKKYKLAERCGTIALVELD